MFRELYNVISTKGIEWVTIVRFVANQMLGSIIDPYGQKTHATLRS